MRFIKIYLRIFYNKYFKLYLLNYCFGTLINASE